MVENGIRKKTPTYRYFARKWSWRNMCFQVRAISSRLWFTYIFAFDSGSLSIAGGWRKCGTLLIFLSNWSTCVLVAAPGRTGSLSKRICRGTLSQKTWNSEIDPPVSRYMYMNAAARGGGALILPTLSTTWLSRSLASEARRLDAHIHGKLRSTLSPLTKKRIPRRPCCSLQVNRRSGLRGQAAKANSFAQVRSPKRTTKS